MSLRDHEPLVIEEFNGLWARGDADSCPLDHFTDCNNVQYIQSGFKTRDGLDTYRAVADVVRLYNYVTPTGESLLVLDIHGNIYHVVSATVVYGPILSIPAMTDFGFIAINGRAYITPFATETNALGVNSQRGIINQFVYVYKGDGTPARKAAGFPPSNSSALSFVAFNSQVNGVVDAGIHLIGVAIDGGILGPEVFPVIIAPGGKQIQLVNIPLGGAARTIVMTRAIDPKDYVADQSTYTYYTALVIADGTTANILLSVDDASLTAVYSPGATAPPVTGAILAENSPNDGFSDFGLHLFGVVYETDTGFLTAPGPEYFAALTMVDITKGVDLSKIPVSPTGFVTRRRLVATKAIPGYNGDQKGYQFFFIPDGEIENNTDTTKSVSFFDADLLEDASHLIENFSEIPAGVTLTTYHGRMSVSATFDDISLVYLSAPGEPEAIDQVDGLLIVPRDGNPVTNCQEFRDVFYVFKRTRTIAFNDNGDVPSSWPLVIMDQGIGAPVHGVGTVLDSGGVNIDFLLIVDFSGLMLFDGAYQRPELSWKIKDYWFELDKNDFHNIQIMNDSLNQKIFITLPNKTILFGDYSNALNYKDIRWSKWTFDIETTTIALLDVDTLIIGAKQSIITIPDENPSPIPVPQPPPDAPPEPDEFPAAPDDLRIVEIS